MGDQEEVEVGLIVGAGRSGTTLLRLILDAHLSIGCPAEAGVPALISHAAGVWWTVDAAYVGQRTPGADDGAAPRGDTQLIGTNASAPQGQRTPPMARLPPHAQRAVREAVLAPMKYYCARESKRIYCDKSLDSVYHLGAVNVLFPRARYVLAFRHVMDTVASGLEASPWGFQGYGYLPYVQSSADNFVAALASHWLSHVEAALHWEKEHPDLCHRVRYEDLVAAPEETVSRIFGFLGVDVDLSVLERAFVRARNETGPGDYKVTYTSAVHAASVGRGKRVPLSMIPPPLLEMINAKLVELGYEQLTRAWNTEPTVRQSVEGNGTVWSTRLSNLMSGTVLPAASGETAELGSFAVIAEDHEELRWVIEPAAGEIRQGDGEVESVVTGTGQDLVLMIAQEENLGVLLRSGRIRHLTAREDVPEHEVARTMNGVLKLLREGVARSNGLKPAALG